MSDCGECQSLVASFQERLSSRRVPLQATIELTYRCNFDCVHCYNVKSRVGGELSLDEWTGVLDQLASEGCVLLTFTGGEPLVHPDFFAIAEAARKRRFAIKLLTNASLVTEAIADRLCGLQPLQIDVSFYGATDATFADVTGRADGFQRTYDGVRRLRARGLRVIAKVPLLRENFHERWEIEKLALELSDAVRVSDDIFPKDDGDPAPQEHALTDAQLAVWLTETKTAARPERHYRPEDKLCRPGTMAVAFGPQGDVYPCIQIKRPMGNLRERSFRDIWNDPAIDELTGLRAGDFHTCSGCGSFGSCKPCLGVSLRENGTLTGNNREGCRREAVRSSLALPILT